MTQPRIRSRIPEKFAVGERVSFTRTFSDGDMSLFIGATWDINPYHTDDTFTATTRFKRRILPGLLPASMATHLGGLWGFLATEMNLEFVAPVYIGDTVTIEVEITAVEEPRQKVRARCRWVNAEGVEVLRGGFAGYPAQRVTDGE
ncbi:MAG TPA: MaoC family dehydratase [Pirellulales bacterium]|jgi:3-hydroxybutyryl-CoA dehydratase